jgi:hypothetical protein
MEIVNSMFIGMISSKIVGMIAGIGLQCRRGSRRCRKQKQEGPTTGETCYVVSVSRTREYDARKGFCAEVQIHRI